MAQTGALPEPSNDSRRSEPTRPSSLRFLRFGGADLMVSLRELKALVQGLDAANPVRVLVLGEPDEIPRSEYAAKVAGWYRLIAMTVDRT
jgi:hypothetical protein